MDPLTQGAVAGLATVAAMEPVAQGAVTALVAVAAAAGGYYVARLLDRRSLSGIQAQTQQLLDQARVQADNLQKEAELRAKDELFAKREALSREFDQKLNDVRDQERRLEKREDLLDQKVQAQ